MTIVIFGATSGIGKSLAERYVKDGHHVYITGRRLENLNTIKKTNPDLYSIKQHDVTDFDATAVFFEELAKHEQPIDIIIYNAGIGAPNYNLDWDNEFSIINTNTMGAVRVFGLAYQLFKKQGFGHIVGVSSIAGIRGNRHVPAYFASKAFLNNYLESLWLKGKRSKANIVVTDIIPGFVDTDLALGNTFWMASLDKASDQIYKAIQKKKKRAIITKRWRIIAFVLRRLPAGLLLKM
jgi:short-subunit dehydrogenase